MTTIESFIDKLKKIGVDITLSSNYPWVYLEEVNGLKVTEKLSSDHGFTVFFLAIRPGESDRITDITRVFEVIRKYVKLSFPTPSEYCEIKEQKDGGISEDFYLEAMEEYANLKAQYHVKKALKAVTDKYQNDLDLDGGILVEDIIKELSNAYPLTNIK